MRAADDESIAQYAQAEGWCILTGDYGFGNVLDYRPEAYAGIVVLRIPPTATAVYINQLIETFMEQHELVAQLTGKLAIVEPGSVRLRGA